MKKHPCSWMRKLCIAKMSMITILIDKFNTSPIKILAGSILRYRQFDYKIYMER
jgi:hypothetical protein